MTTPGRKLRDLLETRPIVEGIGVHDVASARLVEESGFDCVYAGGSAACQSVYGLPDIGIITMTELIDHSRRICAAVDIPVVADLDDGGGNPLRVYRTVRLAEAAGVAAFHLEDNDFAHGKHFASADGSLDLAGDGRLDPQWFCQFLRAAADARVSDDTMIIARTDAALVSIDEAIERSNLYVEAGADLVFCHWTPFDQVSRVAQAVHAPYVYMAHDVTETQLDQLANDGAKLLLRPSFSWAVGFMPLVAGMRGLKEDRALADFAARKGAPEERFAMLKSLEWAALAEKYGMKG